MAEAKFKPIAILGAGSWGTALALYLSRRGQAVRLWSIEPSEVEAIHAEKANNRYLPGFNFPDTIQAFISLAETVENVEDVMIVVPSIGFRETLTMLKPLLSSNSRIICATKGLDAKTGQLPNEIVKDVTGKEYPFAVLSGPSFAREVAASLPTAVVIASQHRNFIADLIKRFDSPIFHIYPSTDVVGVELGGIVKNVIAIATGISDGMELGVNARSALITHGLAETIHLGTALGGKIETFIGLSGLGDLILTATDNQSRNRRLGLAIGKGNNLKEAEHEIGQAVEGKRNAELVTLIAHRHQVKMPVCEAIWQVLQEKLDAKTAIDKILASEF